MPLPILIRERAVRRVLTTGDQTRSSYEERFGGALLASTILAPYSMWTGCQADVTAGDSIVALAKEQMNFRAKVNAIQRDPNNSNILLVPMVIEWTYTNAKGRKQNFSCVKTIPVSSSKFMKVCPLPDGATDETRAMLERKVVRLEQELSKLKSQLGMAQKGMDLLHQQQAFQNAQMEEQHQSLVHQQKVYQGDLLDNNAPPQSVPVAEQDEGGVAGSNVVLMGSEKRTSAPEPSVKRSVARGSLAPPPPSTASTATGVTTDSIASGVIVAAGSAAIVGIASACLYKKRYSEHLPGVLYCSHGLHVCSCTECSPCGFGAACFCDCHGHFSLASDSENSAAFMKMKGALLSSTMDSPHNST